MTHECELTKRWKYEISDLEGRPTLYDKQTHAYLINILYCPFCGEKL